MPSGISHVRYLPVGEGRPNLNKQMLNTRFFLIDSIASIFPYAR